MELDNEFGHGAIVQVKLCIPERLRHTLSPHDLCFLSVIVLSSGRNVVCNMGHIPAS